MSELCRIFHDAPYLKISDPQVLKRFLQYVSVNTSLTASELIFDIARAFSVIPYENLTKIIKTDAVVNAKSAMRYPDELLSDYMKWGTGGTCFSLTAAMIAVFGHFGIETHPVLADRHYGVDTHCGLMILNNNTFFLLDPGYLLFTPTRLPSLSPITIDTPFNSIELVPLSGGQRVELYTAVKGNRRLRLTYKIEPVSDEAFGRAWEQSFAWEMMTYPVLTRCINGKHKYLQGTTLRIRDAVRTSKQDLDLQSQGNFITSELGIHKDIVQKAFGVIKHGRYSPSGSA